MGAAGIVSAGWGPGLRLPTLPRSPTSAVWQVCRDFSDQDILLSLCNLPMLRLEVQLQKENKHVKLGRNKVINAAVTWETI